MATAPGPEALGVDLLVAPFLAATEWDALDLTATDPRAGPLAADRSRRCAPASTACARRCCCAC